MNKSLSDLINLIKHRYPDQKPVPLHAPVFFGNEKKYLNECIETTFVSYVGSFVSKFEEMTAQFTGSKYAVAVVNGTAALQLALLCAGVKPGDEVITQALTFVATANAVSHCGAKPVFVDVDKSTLGMSPDSLEDFLSSNCIMKDGKCVNKNSGNTISAIVPMHTFGHSCKIEEIIEIADRFNINVIEDSAESLGSYYKGRHTGTFGLAGILSYNGNKTITTGGGGMIITDNKEFAEKAKHLSTTAKKPHAWEFVHDMIAFNYRLTNVSAAIGTAQMEVIDQILKNKRETSQIYKDFFKNTEYEFINEPQNSKSNYWLNAFLLNDKKERDEFLNFSSENSVMCRPIWNLMTDLEMYKDCRHDSLSNSKFLQERIVNLPSSYIAER